MGLLKNGSVTISDKLASNNNGRHGKSSNHIEEHRAHFLLFLSFTIWGNATDSFPPC
jgi:hypothetical protein